MTHCNDKPICTPTSLDPIPNGKEPDQFDFDDHCRDLAEQLCKAMVRRVEQFRRQERRRNPGNPQLPQKMIDWKHWAAGRTAEPGLPDCLDPQENQGVDMEISLAIAAGSGPGILSNAKKLNRTANAMTTGARLLVGYDVDDWHGE